MHRFIVVAATLVALATPAHAEEHKPGEELAVVHDGVLKVWMQYVKWDPDEGEWGFRVLMQNLSDKRLRIPSEHMRCARGAVEGKFDGIDRVFPPKPGKTHKDRAKCELPDNARGPFTLHIDKVFFDGEDEPVVTWMVWSLGEDGQLLPATSPGRRMDAAAAPAPAVAPAPAPAPTPAPVAPRAAPAVDAHGLEVGASPMAVKRYLIGKELYLQGNVQGAAQEFQGAFDIFPRSAKLAFNLARCYERLGKTREALKYYEEYLKLAPPDAADRADIQRLTEAMRKRL